MSKAQSGLPTAARQNDRRTDGLSKSRIAAFEQCPKRLWLSVHRPELADGEATAQQRLSAGEEVGAIARDLHPGGYMVSDADGLARAIETTADLLRSGFDRPIFEATFEHEGVLVRIDVLEPLGSGRWRLAEVKSTASAKPYHGADLATQIWAAQGAGLNVGGAVIRHINTQFVLTEPSDYQGLFTDADLFDALQPIVAGRADVVADAMRTLSSDEPARDPGDHCIEPFDCPFLNYCSRDMPKGPEWPVTILPNGGGKPWLAKGFEDLLAVPEEELTRDVHRVVLRATRSGEPYHDMAGAKAAIDQWAWPRTWLDFETIAFAAPRWVGTRPYEAIPFQFSAHIETSDGAITHKEFLSLDGSDPRRACAEALVTLPSEGAVIAYFATFERARLRELAAAFDDLAPALLALEARVVDLLPVARANWYHRDQRGSWSIKAVLPTVAPHLDYSDLAVGNGSQAQEAYIEAISGASPERLQALSEGLRIYCSRDTEAMIVLAWTLYTGMKED